MDVRKLIKTIHYLIDYFDTNFRDSDEANLKAYLYALGVIEVLSDEKDFEIFISQPSYDKFCEYIDASGDIDVIADIFESR